MVNSHSWRLQWLDEIRFMFCGIKEEIKKWVSLAILWVQIKTSHLFNSYFGYAPIFLGWIEL